MTSSHRLATRHFTPQILAHFIQESFHSTEYGWSNTFGTGWEDAVKRLLALPPGSSASAMRQAVSLPLLIHIPELLCASCFAPTFSLVNLGREPSTFWVCEKCLGEATQRLQEIALAWSEN